MSGFDMQATYTFKSEEDVIYKFKNLEDIISFAKSVKWYAIDVASTCKDLYYDYGDKLCIRVTPREDDDTYFFNYCNEEYYLEQGCEVKLYNHNNMLVNLL